MVGDLAWDGVIILRGVVESTATRDPCGTSVCGRFARLPSWGAASRTDMVRRHVSEL